MSTTNCTLKDTKAGIKLYYQSGAFRKYAFALWMSVLYVGGFFASIFALAQGLYLYGLYLGPIEKAGESLFSVVPFWMFDCVKGECLKGFAYGFAQVPYVICLVCVLAFAGSFLHSACKAGKQARIGHPE